MAKQLADKFGFPARAVMASSGPKKDKKDEIIPNPFETEEDSAVLLKDLQTKKRSMTYNEY